MAFTIKQGDLRPLFVVTLKDNVGEAGEAVVNLTTAGTVFFNMRAAGGGAMKINRGVAAVTSAALGQVTYTWGTADVATVGEFEAEMEVVWNDGKPETFPNNGYWEVTIYDDIA